MEICAKNGRRKNTTLHLKCCSEHARKTNALHLIGLHISAKPKNAARNRNRSRAVCKSPYLSYSHSSTNSYKIHTHTYARNARTRAQNYNRSSTRTQGHSAATKILKKQKKHYAQNLHNK